jgi:protein-disulfide isomerase
MLRKILFLLLFLLTAASSLAAAPAKETPEKVARDFVVSLGKNYFEKSWSLLSKSSQDAIAQKTINRFEDLDDAVYTVEEMKFLLLTNSEGHRTVMFEDLTKQWCAKIGVAQAALRKVKVIPLKEDGKKAVVRLEMAGKKVNMNLVNEGDWNPRWKVVWMTGK